MMCSTVTKRMKPPLRTITITGLIMKPSASSDLAARPALCREAAAGGGSERGAASEAGGGRGAAG